MRFQVPQFIETEAKVIGPLTLRQFIYIAAGAILVLIVGYMLPLSYAVYLIIIIAVVAIALAFVKVDGITLPHMIALAAYYLISPKRYYYHAQETAAKDELDEFINLHKQSPPNP